MSSAAVVTSAAIELRRSADVGRAAHRARQADARVADGRAGVDVDGAGLAERELGFDEGAVGGGGGPGARAFLGALLLGQLEPAARERQAGAAGDQGGGGVADLGVDRAAR